MGQLKYTHLLLARLIKALARLEVRAPWLHHRRAAVLALGLLITIVFVVLGLAQPRFLITLEYKLQDQLLRNHPISEPSGQVLIVDLDEESLARFGQWPWPRYRVALLLRELRKRGAAGIGLDMVFAEPDRTSPVNIIETFKQELGLAVNLEGIPPGFQDNDNILAGALSQSPSTLGFVFLFNQSRPQKGACLSRPLTWQGFDGDESSPTFVNLFKADELLCNLPLLARAAKFQGFMNAAPDEDGVLRRIPLVMLYQGRLFPSLALGTRLASFQSRSVGMSDKGSLGMALRLGTEEVPLDNRGRILINYRGGNGSIPRISAAELFSDRPGAQEIKGKYVLVGTSARGLAELRATPFDSITPGVEIQATILDNLIKKDFIIRPPRVRYFELGLTAFLGLAFSLLLAVAGARLSLGVFGGTSVALWLLTDWALKSHGILASPTYPYLVMSANLAFLGLLRFRLEEVRARRRADELISVQDLVMQAMAALAETRDNETGGHIIRTQRYVMILGRELSRMGRPHDRQQLNLKNVDLMGKSAPLHDIGKVGISDSILLKPGKLTPDEYQIMKKHAYLGKTIIQNAENRVGSQDSSQFLHFAKEIAYCHHEKWDGSGYPQGLAGEDIPLSGRLMALADVYDALVSRRVYKEPFSHQKALEIIRDVRGSHFDPQVVDAFLRTQEEFCQTALELADSEDERVILIGKQLEDL